MTKEEIYESLKKSRIGVATTDPYVGDIFYSDIWSMITTQLDGRTDKTIRRDACGWICRKLRRDNFWVHS